MDQLTQIKAFVATIDSGGFSPAARHANTSVSSIARQVKALEDELGVRLINRTTRSQSLTEAGRIFYERTRDVLQDLEAAKTEALSFQSDVKGLLRVTARVLSGMVIQPALPAFLERYPDLTLELSLTDERLDLVANGIDVAVWLGDLDDSKLITRRLTPSKRVVCGSPAYFAKHGVPRKPTDLASHNCIVFKAKRYRDVWKFAKDGEQLEVQVKGNLRSQTGSVMLAGALAGIGVTVMQEYLVRSHLQEGSLQRVLSDYDMRPIDGDAALNVVYPHNKGMSRNTRAFVDFLVTLFGDKKSDKSS
jgi:DNA-binding transcriptional LysR family regulator